MSMFKDTMIINNQKVFKRAIIYDSSFYLLFIVSYYKKTADSAHCSVIYFADFSLSISHSNVTYFMVIKIKAILVGSSVRDWKIKLTCGKNCCGLFHVKVWKIEWKPTGIHPYHLPPTTPGLLPWSTIIHIIQRNFTPIQLNSATLRPSSHTQAIDHHKCNYKPDSSLI